MLKISTKSTYAIRALVHIAQYSPNKAEALASISKKENIPLPFLEQIFSKLKKAGFVQAVRGPQGGFRLARPAAQISLADIISILEGPIEPVLCTIPENRSPECHEVDGCTNRSLCCELDGAIQGILTKHTIGSMSVNSSASQTIKFVI